MNIAAALLAAGASRRYGRPKQIEVFQGVPLVRRAAQTALDAGLPLTVVLGANAKLIKPALQGLPYQALENTEWDEGMGHSISCAFSALLQQQPVPDATLLLLADQPGVTALTLRRLLDTYQRNPQNIIISDYNNGAQGPPVLFPNRFFAALSGLQGDTGAHRILQRHSESVSAIHAPEAALDIDTPEDLDAALSATGGG